MISTSGGGTFYKPLPLTYPCIRGQKKTNKELERRYSLYQTVRFVDNTLSLTLLVMKLRSENQREIYGFLGLDRKSVV